MVKFGILSIGEGGSNIGEYASQKGFPVIAVNTAKIDLSKLKNVHEDSKIHLHGWEGAGRNREVGRESILHFGDQIFEKAKVKFNDCDLIFVAGSTSGGTGSGGLPIGIEIISAIKERVGVITTLPDEDESAKAQMNCLECFSELSNFEQLASMFIVDNQRFKEVFGEVNRSKYYQLSTQQVIDNLHEVSLLCSQTSYVSNFDKHDLMSILLERGVCLISKLQVPIESISNSDSFSQLIKGAMKKTCSPTIYDSQIVKAAILGKVSPDVTTLINTKNIFDNIPYDLIEAYYTNSEHQNHGIFYSLASGLSFPMERLKSIEQSIKLVEQDLVDKFENSQSQKFESENWSSKFKKTKPSKEKLSLSQRLERFK